MNMCVDLARKLLVRALLFSCIFFQMQLLFGQIALENITSESGIDHSHTSPIYMGGGVAFLDFNNDGLDDIYLTGGALEDKIYQNQGGLKFVDVTSKLGLKRVHDGQSMSVTAGDFDNDGFDDIFVTYGEKELSRLYHNEGGAKFKDITALSGIDSEAWAMGATFIDANMDGHLDLYVINWVSEFEAILDDDGEAVGFNHTCYANNLYINNGDGTFLDKSPDYEVNNTGCGLAVLATDFNDDTFPDLYMANDFGEWVTENTIYQNEFPNTTFTNRSAESGLNVQIYGMGIAQGDYDRDGYQDYYITNIGANVLLHNDGSHEFMDLAGAAGALNKKYHGFNTTGWGTVFADLNNDGFEELIVANGFVPAADFIQTTEEDPNKIYLNNQDGTFTDISDRLGVSTMDISRGVAVSDLDNDGDLDVLFTHLSTDLSGKKAEENVYLYENKTSDAGYWLRIKLKGSDCGTNAFNARVRVYSGGSKNFQMRELTSGTSHASQNTSVVHFGLGQHNKVDSVFVVWPAGETITFYSDEINVDHTYLIDQATRNIKSMGCQDLLAINHDQSAEINSGCVYSTITHSHELSLNQDVILQIDNENQWVLLELATPIAAITRIEIINMSGIKLLEEKWLSGSDHFEFSTAGWKAGVYIIKMEDPQLQLKFQTN